MSTCPVCYDTSVTCEYADSGTLVDLPCGCQDVHYPDGRVCREHDHVHCDGQPRKDPSR